MCACSIVLGLLFLALSTCCAEPLTPAVEAEVRALLIRLESSGCKFNRNGTWYRGQDARDHHREEVPLCGASVCWAEGLTAHDRSRLGPQVFRNQHSGGLNAANSSILEIRGLKTQAPICLGCTPMSVQLCGWQLNSST
jgi:hypothetical protein